MKKQHIYLYKCVHFTVALTIRWFSAAGEHKVDKSESIMKKENHVLLQHHCFNNIEYSSLPLH